MFYTGIGSRKTPDFVLNEFAKLAKYLDRKLCLTLRSGGANGADTAFENGTDNKEIFIPSDNFNGRSFKDSGVFSLDKLDKDKVQQAESILKDTHPYYSNLKEFTKRLHLRNTFQVLGKNLDTLSLFLVCYTENAKEVGETAQAIRIAKLYNIPIFNYGIYKNEEEMIKDRRNTLKKMEGILNG